jgi:predicted dehydrogenase/flavin reductase (DIM6/NTAB) family NADH-FMN oxidoreductase RutF
MKPRLTAQIWDTSLQCVCSIVAARAEHGVELWGCSNFAPVSEDPPRVGVNPNVVYPIDEAILKAGRFSISIMPASRLEDMKRMFAVRRRDPDKPGAVGLTMGDRDGIPFVEDVLRVVFCEVEKTAETGDHRLIIGRVIENRPNPARQGELPVMYKDALRGTGLAKRASYAVRSFLLQTGLMDLILARLGRTPRTPNLRKETYRGGGYDPPHIAEVLRPGGADLSRVIHPPKAPAILRQSIGLCVVGTRWGLTHAELVSKHLPQVKLSICGQDPKRTTRIARQLGARHAFTSIAEAAAHSDVQACLIALPHHLHRSATEEVLRHGKHVLVEKPIATTLADADAMMAAARQAKRLLMVAENMHFRPDVAAAVRRISAGDIGEPVYSMTHVSAPRAPESWHGDAALAGGGPWMDYGVHQVRAIRLLMGEPDRILATRGMQMHVKMSAEDSLQVLLASRYGWQSHVFVSWLSGRGTLPEITVCGDRGQLQIYAEQPYFDFFPNAPTPITELIDMVRPYSLQAKLRHPDQQRIRIPVPPSDAYLAEIREFLAAITEGREPVTPMVDGRRDLEIVLRGYDALKSGQWEEIPAPARP